MLTLWGQPQRFCDGVSRRDFLRAGALGLGGLTLSDLLRADEAGGTRSKSVIYIVLDGGPSHIDMWDLKPAAPAEYRGPFNPIATRLAGVHICEHMPRQASIMDQLALLRGIRSVENDHFLAEVYTGLPRSAGRRPAFGAVASRLLGHGAASLPAGMNPAARLGSHTAGMNPAARALPTYVSLNRPTTDEFEYEKPHYAGSGHAPFRPFGSALQDLSPVRSLEQLRDRRALLTAFDTMRRDLDAARGAAALDRHHAQALEIITSPRVRDAFDLSREPQRVIDSYGRGRYPHQTVKDIFYDWDAKPFVLARRLVEAGVRVVTLRAGSWDHHSGPQSDIFHALAHLLPVLDRSIHALVNDLKARGLDQDVLVVVLGEFGRTPRISYPGPGREHWADAGCAVLFGGGLEMGQVIGATDSRGEMARTGHITFQNIVATIYHVLGIDARAQLVDFNGRPQNLLDDIEPIRELVG